MTALAGRSVLVTRSREQASELCAALAARGARTVTFPSIEIVPVAGAAVELAVRSLDQYDWIAFTSVNAVAWFWEALRGSGQERLGPRAAVAAVGSATRAALERRGVSVAAVPERYVGTELAGALGPLEHRRVLLPRSDIGREHTAAALRDAGATVDEVVFYRTVTARPSAAALRALEGGIDAVTFTSPSTVRGFLEAGGAAASRALRHAVVACIGPVTGEAARAAGLSVHVQPEVHTASALVEALERHFAARPAGLAR